MNGEQGNEEFVFQSESWSFNIFQQREQGYEETEPGRDHDLPVEITMRCPGTRFGYKQKDQYRNNKREEGVPEQFAIQ